MKVRRKSMGRSRWKLSTTPVPADPETGTYPLSWPLLILNMATPDQRAKSPLFCNMISFVPASPLP